MSNKFCPFSFFSFYINKDSAQAGGAHHCVEGSCALWDSRYEQCSVKTACENIGGVPSTQSKKPRSVSNIIAKIRSKKKPGEASAPEVNSTEAAVPAQATPPITDAVQASSAEVVVTEVDSETLKPKVDLKELLVAPDISANKLPIVAPSQETDNGSKETG